MTAQTDIPTGNSHGILASDYAVRKRKLMGLIDQIRSTGASVDLDLPTIIVAGNQSSGKSSLIEAISGINLPRAAGTCTRVPIEVRLRQDSERDWQCAVKIRLETGDGRQDASQDGEPEQAFGPVLTDVALVEDTIRRAQLAILNPSVPFDRFVKYEIPADEEQKPLGSSKQLAFSRNVVVLEITGPNVTDLTLVDLPGLIQNVAAGEDPENIGLVQDLVKSYISKEYLILLVITMKDDLENQAAVRLATEADPDGKRTIGVLTKVDTLRGREIDRWVKVLKNEKHHLAHGYFVTRQPDADELAAPITFSQARAKEDNFFTVTQPWNSLQAEWSARLGTKKLTAALSDHLLAFIQTKLPGLIQNVEDSHSTIRQELGTLGKPPSDDPAREMMDLVDKFYRIVDVSVMGGPGPASFIQNVRAASEDFRKGIRSTAPAFTPFTAQESKLERSKDASVRRQLDRDVAGEIKDFAEDAVSGVAGRPKITNLDMMRQHINNAITRELPNNVPFAAKVELMRESTATWTDLALRYLSTVRPLLVKLLDDALADTFAKDRTGVLPSRVRQTVQEQIDNLADSTQAQILKMTRLEERPYTMNLHYLDDLEAKLLEKFRAERLAFASPAPTALVASAAHPAPFATARADGLPTIAQHNSFFPPGQSNFGGFGPVKLPEPSISTEGRATVDPPKVLGADAYDTELKVMAEVRAYWQVAYKRIIDNIPRIIDAEFVLPAAKDIRDALIGDLHIFDQDAKKRCGELLAEPSQKRVRRETLLERKDRLGRARAAIDEFSRK